MKLLLDTHIFLWFANADKQLPTSSKNLIEDTENECFISIASLWEIAIKHSQGKLALEIPFSQFWELAISNQIQVLGIDFSHLITLLDLPYIHKDPFDRIMIAQAISEQLFVITQDAYFAEYPIQLKG